MYCRDRLIGPCEREKLSSVEGFDANTLVCPEEEAGSYPQQWKWQRAIQVPDLALYVLPGESAGEAAGENWGTMLPPEPTLGDAAEINSLQEKLRSLAGAVQRLRERMAEQDARIAELKGEVSEREKALNIAIQSIYSAQDQGARYAELKAEIAELRSEVAGIGEGRPVPPVPPSPPPQP